MNPCRKDEDMVDADREKIMRIEKLRAAYAVIEEERAAAMGAKRRRDELTYCWTEFACSMRMLNPQSSGTRFERYFSQFYNWTPLSQALGTGDARTEEGLVVETKTTSITSSNRSANFVQIRQHQEIDRYSCFVIEQDLSIVRFDLSKEQMAAEIEALGTSAHGTKDAVSANSTVEWAVRVPWNDVENEHYKRWMENYRTSRPGTVTPDMMNPYEYESAAEIHARLARTPDATIVHDAFGELVLAA